MTTLSPRIEALLLAEWGENTPPAERRVIGFHVSEREGDGEVMNDLTFTLFGYDSDDEYDLESTRGVEIELRFLDVEVDYVRGNPDSPYVRFGKEDSLANRPATTRRVSVLDPETGRTISVDADLDEDGIFQFDDPLPRQRVMLEGLSPTEMDVRYYIHTDQTSGWDELSKLVWEQYQTALKK